MGSLCVSIGRGMSTTIDDDVWESVLAYNPRRGGTQYYRPCDVRWYAAKNRNYWYACSSGGMFLHRLLTQCESHLVVDHINGDTLNNQLENLRCCTIAENSRREFVRRGGYSTFRGVKKGGKYKPFAAQIHITRHGKKRCFSLGAFSTEREAAEAYDRAAIELFGPLAVLNFPP